MKVGISIILTPSSSIRTFIFFVNSSLVLASSLSLQKITKNYVRAENRTYWPPTKSIAPTTDYSKSTRYGY
jgi:hypothetical protein